jgi:predicted Co/Zn/Cd cation transporter (cation efflux family)
VGSGDQPGVGQRFADKRGLSAIDGANALIVIFVIVQMWLLSAALEAALAGKRETALPAAIVSGILFAGCALLFRFVTRLDRQVRGRR